MKAICVGARHRNYNKLNKQTGAYDPVDETVLYFVHSSPVDGLHGNVVKAISIPYGKFNLVENTYDDLIVSRYVIIDLIPYGDSFLIEDIIPGDKVVIGI